MIDQRGEIERLLQEGMAAARSGQRGQAQTLLRRVLQLDGRNEQAWLWLSGVAETDAQRIDALEQVLRINPTNSAAQKGLDLLRRQAGQQPAAAPAAAPAVPARPAAETARPAAPAQAPAPAVAPESSPLDDLRPMLAARNQRKRFGVRTSEIIIVIVVLIVGCVLIRLFLDRTFPEPSRPAGQAEEAPILEPATEVPAAEVPVEEAPVEEAPVEEAPVEEAPVEEVPPEEAPVEEVPPEITSGLGSYSSGSYTLVVDGSSADVSRVQLQVTLQNPTMGNLRFHGGDFRLVDSTGAELPLDANQSSLVRGNMQTYRSIAAQDQVGGTLIFSGGGTAPYQLIWTPSDGGPAQTIGLG